MKRTILITGGSGLLALNWALSTRDRHAVTLGMHARAVALAGVQMRRLNLESVDDLLHAFDKVQPSLVVHAAGMTSVEDCEARPEMAQHINVDLAANVAAACERLGCSLVHISTDHLFAGQQARGAETDIVSPQNMYARTKAEAESRILEIHPKALVVRTNFYGWGPSYRHSFSDVIVEALRNGRQLTLFHDVFYTPTLIEVVVQAVHELSDRKAGGVFHVVGDERISKYDFGLKVAEHFQLDAAGIKSGSLADHPGLVRRPRDMSLSNRKTCDLLGRKLGGVNEHLAQLRQQEQHGFVQEIRKL